MRFLKLFGFISVMIVHTKCKLNNAELFLELPVIQSKENRRNTTKKTKIT